MASETRLRVFLDANVLFSALYNPHGIPGVLLNAASRGVYEAIVTEEVLDEARRNLHRKAPTVPSGRLEMVRTAVRIVPPAPREEVENWLQEGFAEDAHVLAAAINGRSSHLCTGDRGLMRKLVAANAPVQAIRPNDLFQLISSR